MPDLSLDACRRFWHDYDDPHVYRVLTFLEGVEGWTLDGDEALEAALRKLGDVLADIGGVDLQKESDFLTLGVYLRFMRALRLLECLDSAHPGAASKLLQYAENAQASGDKIADLFLKRNMVFERLRLISRVFAKDRVELVRKLLED